MQFGIAVAESEVVTMMVLVSYASRHGSTREVAERLAAGLVERGCQVKVRPVDQVSDLRAYDAVVLGSAVEAGAWLAEAVRFIDRLREALVGRPVWLFSVGLKGTQRGLMGAIFNTQGEPKDVERIQATIHPRGYRRFTGAIERGELTGLRRLIFDGLGGQYGDFRDWQDIADWAEQIARDLALMPAGRL